MKDLSWVRCLYRVFDKRPLNKNVSDALVQTASALLTGQMLAEWTQSAINGTRRQAWRRNQSLMPLADEGPSKDCRVMAYRP